MKSKIMITALSTLALISLGACGKDCPPDHRRPTAPPIHYDGWAKMSYVDVDTGVKKDVSVGLNQEQGDYLGADTLSLPADLPDEVSVEADIPLSVSGKYLFDYVPMIALDGQASVMALTNNPALTVGESGKVYSVDLTHVRETLPPNAVSGVFKIEMFPTMLNDPVQTIQIRFQKPASL